MSKTPTPAKTSKSLGASQSFTYAKAVELLEEIREDARKLYDNDITIMLNISMVINEFKARALKTKDNEK